MDYVPCQERDRIILAFVLAVNAQNHVTSNLEGLVDNEERHKAIASIEAGRGHCYELRDRLLHHCQKHGC
jgi:hypothetical protein